VVLEGTTLAHATKNTGTHTVTTGTCTTGMQNCTTGGRAGITGTKTVPTETDCVVGMSRNEFMDEECGVVMNYRLGSTVSVILYLETRSRIWPLRRHP
jgi:hypothetical protein